MDYKVLKTEMDTDPKNLGYSGKNDQAIAALLNTTGLSEETINRGVIPSYEVVSACEVSELSALTDKEQSILSFIVSAGQVNTGDSKIKAIFAGLFGAVTTTRANLLALAIRSASRAEVLFGKNISSMDVHVARRQ